MFFSLYSYILQLSSVDISSQEALHVSSALEDLAHFMRVAPNDRETKDRQKLLRNLHILEKVTTILDKFDKNASDAR